MATTRHDRFALDFRPERLRRLWDFDVDLEESFKIEEFRDGGEFVIRAELPGMNPEEDVEVTVSEHVLHMRGHRTERSEHKTKESYRSEFRYGEFRREMPLPPGAKESDIKATFKDGILEVRVPVSEETKPPVTRVPVTAA